MALEAVVVSCGLMGDQATVNLRSQTESITTETPTLRQAAGLFQGIVGQRLDDSDLAGMLAGMRIVAMVPGEAFVAHNRASRAARGRFK